MDRKELMLRYAKKTINPKLYGVVKFKDLVLKGQEDKTLGHIYVPYIPIVIKTISVDENGTHITWNISKWMRLKLWFLKLIGKLKKIG